MRAIRSKKRARRTEKEESENEEAREERLRVETVGTYELAAERLEAALEMEVKEEVKEDSEERKGVKGIKGHW